MIGRRIGSRVGRRAGAALGIANDPIGSGLALPAFDGSTTVYRPTTLNHWLALGFDDRVGQGRPSHDFLCDEASGNLIDHIRGTILTASGSPTYREPATGNFASVGVGCTEVAGQGFFAPAGELWDTLYQDVLIMFEARIRAAPGSGVNRGIIALTGAASMYIATFLSGAEARLQCRSGSVVSGTLNHLGGRFVGFIRLSPPATVINHVGSGTYTLSTNLGGTPPTVITGVYSEVSDATKGIGAASSGSITPANMVIHRLTTWHGARAVNTNATTAMQKLGWIAA